MPSQRRLASLSFSFLICKVGAEIPHLTGSYKLRVLPAELRARSLVSGPYVISDFLKKDGDKNTLDAGLVGSRLLLMLEAQRCVWETDFEGSLDPWNEAAQASRHPRTRTSA